MSRSILMTGASGFVGTYLRAAIAARWPDATVTGLGIAFDMTGHDELVALDLTDRKATDAICGDTKPDVVIHLAGQASVARADQSDGDLTWTTNVTGAVNLATSIARHAPNSTVLAVSSAEVYGASFLSSPVSETSTLVPMNAYAKSKIIAERIFAEVLPSTARLLIVRPSNHTGAGQREDFVLPSFAGQVARIEAGLQAPAMMVGNINVRRDFLDVRDVVAAYVALLDAAPRLPTRFTCNIASGQAQPLRAYVEMLQGLAKVPFEVVVDPARLRPVDLPVAYADPALLVGTTGWTPRIALEDTLKWVLDAARARVAADLRVGAT